MITAADIQSELFLRVPAYCFRSYDPARLPEVLADIYFQNALFLASPAFFGLIKRRRFAYDLLNDKERFTLLKYYNRMCFRPTPFGSFASFTITRFSEYQKVFLEPADQAILHLLPDQYFRDLPALRPHEEALLTINPTLYRIGEELRYIKMATDNAGKHLFSIASTEADVFTVSLLAAFGKGKVSVGRLLRLIERRSLCSAAEAEEYLEFLIGEQVLYLPGHGTVIGNSNKQWVGMLNSEQGLPGKAACRPSCIRLDLLDTRLKVALKVPDIDRDRPLFYAALERKSTYGGIDETDQEELAAALNAMRRLTGHVQNESLQEFIKAFGARYDRKKVPLLVALDPDMGIAYAGLTTSAEAGNGILSGLPFPDAKIMSKKQHWFPTNQLLTRLWLQKPNRTVYEPVIITESDINDLPQNEQNRLPPSMPFMFRKASGHLQVESAAGVTGNSLIGRFTAFDSKVAALCNKITGSESEANPGVVFADISQLTGKHVDNINQRAAIYPYEITLTVYAETVKAKQIAADDLLLSVIQGELILESVRLKKRIIPRLATAYNFRLHELSIFRLLCDLQYQSVCASLTFSPETYFPNLDFYPRIQFEQTVISPAKWRFKSEEMELFRNEVSMKGKGKALCAFRDRYKLPQWVAIGDTDQQLIFNLAEPDEQAFFLQSVKGLKEVVISEYLLPDRSVKSGHQPFAGQFVGFIINQKEVYKPLEASANHRPVLEYNNSGKWIYYRLYCSERTANIVLWDVVYKFISAHPQLANNWFFLRYNDEKGPHLRFRFFAEATETGLLIKDLEELLRAAFMVHLLKDYQSAVYQPELERYASCPISLIESFFCAGSRLVIKKSGQEETLESEFELAIITANMLITEFLGRGELMEIYTRMVCENFLREFGADKSLRLALDRKYREFRPRLSILIQEVKEQMESALFMDLINSLGAIMAHISSFSESGQFKLLSDLVHMQLNRTFSTEQRKHELLVYYFLNKYYNKIIAMAIE